MNAVATRPFEVSLGSGYSPYSLPGLHPNGFVSVSATKSQVKSVLSPQTKTARWAPRITAPMKWWHRLVPSVP